MAFPKYSANCKQQTYFWIYTYVNWHSIIPVISHFQAKRLMYLFETFARLLHFLWVGWRSIFPIEDDFHEKHAVHLSIPLNVLEQCSRQCKVRQETPPGINTKISFFVELPVFVQLLPGIPSLMMCENQLTKFILQTQVTRYSKFYLIKISWLRMRSAT